MNAPINRINYNTRQERFWRNLFFVTLIVSGVLVAYLSSGINRDPWVVVADEDALVVVKAEDLMSSESLHEAQAELAVQSIFNRSPTGLDSPKRAQKLFRVEAYQKLMTLVTDESPEFERKSVHQKVGISKIDLLRLKDNSIKVAVEGQLIRSGIFAGEPITEVLDLKVKMLFVNNPSLLGNGGYPTLVRDFLFETTPIPTK